VDPDPAGHAHGTDGRTVDLVPHVLGRRDELVLKPGRGSGGVWVVIGREETQANWAKAVAAALKTKIPWVVQEMVEPHVIPCASRSRPDPSAGISVSPRVANYGCILIDGRQSGLIRRDGDAGFINLNTVQNASAAPVYAFP
jgi:hypothetical protein